MKKFYISILLALFFIGCVQTNVDYNPIRNAQVAKNFQELNSNKVILNEELILSLGDEYQEVIEEGKEKCFAAKIDIINLKKAISVDIKSYASKGFFAPKILFLDKDYKIQKTILAEDLRFDRGYFKGTIFLNEDVEKYDYLIITQDISKVEKSYELNSINASIIPTLYGTLYYASGDIKSKLNSSFGGMVKLTLKVYEPKVLGEDKEK